MSKYFTSRIAEKLEESEGNLNKKMHELEEMIQSKE